MVYQTSLQQSNTIRFGSAKVEVGETIGSLVDLGLASNIEFTEEFTPVEIIPDNGPKIQKGKKDHRANVKFDLWEINFSNVNLMAGGGDVYDTVAGASTPVVDELHTLTGVTGVRLNNKNGDGSICTAISVKDSSNSTAVLNTDYVLYLDAAGYTCIARVSGSTVLTTGEQAKVSYTYVPNASVSLSTGGLTTIISPRIVRLTNVDSAGKKFEITVYKATNQKGISLKFPPDDGDKNLSVSFELRGDVDNTRTAGDQLFKIVDEQGV